MSSYTNDQKLLDAAALELGSACSGKGGPLVKHVDNAVAAGKWSPLEDTENALHLAALLKMTIAFGEGGVVVSRNDHSCVQDLSKGLTGLRRAIVTAAAGPGVLPE